MKYQHLSIEEREKIQELLWQKTPIRTIAKTLSRNPSSVSREIRKNKLSWNSHYAPRKAHERALEHRKHRGRKDRLKNEDIRQYVISHLKRRWSPEQIAGTIEKDIGQKISHEAVYQYIYAQIYRNGYGYAKPRLLDLRPYLRRKRKRRIKKGSRRCQRVFRPKGASIDERPAIVEQRKRVGDWESDTVESKDHKPGVNTLVERKSGWVLITKLESKTSEATMSAIGRRWKNLPSRVKETVTFDNGPENSNWQELETETKVKTFFANPYHSWERGSNENINGLIRDYFPKKTDFSMIPAEEIAYVEYELNTRPRKRLGFKTPLEVFSVALQG